MKTNSGIEIASEEEKGYVWQPHHERGYFFQSSKVQNNFNAAALTDILRFTRALNRAEKRKKTMSEKPRGKFRCVICGKTWDGSELFNDPSTLGGRWTCGDLTCGASVIRAGSQLSRKERSKEKKP